MIRRVKYLPNSQEDFVKDKKLGPEVDDVEAVWKIFKEVISTGDTLTFYPNTPKSVLQEYWFGPEMHTYVY